MVYNSSNRIIIIIALLLTLLLVPMAVDAAEQKQEVAIPASNIDWLGLKGVWCKLGQRLTIDGTVSKIGYKVWRVGNPTGNIIFSIYDVESDELLFSQAWGDASLLQVSGEGSYQIVNVPSLVLSQEVRICVEYYGGNETDYCVAGYYTGDKITGQYYTNYFHYGQWHDIGEAEEGSYYLEYIPKNRDSNESNSVIMGTEIPFRTLGIIGGLCLILGIYLYAKKRQGKQCANA